MSTITVGMYVAEAARTAYTVRTGRTLKSPDQYRLDLGEATPEQRAVLLSFTGYPNKDDACEIPFCGDQAWAASRVPETLEDWLAMATEYAALAEVRRQESAVREAEKAAREAAYQERQKRQRDEALARFAQKLAEAEALDDEALAGALLPDEPWECPDDLRARRVALVDRRHLIVAQRRAEQEAAEAAERVQREAERKQWIDAHGSDFLRKAVGAGYDCQRRYVTERAGVEHPSAVVDFQDHADWKSRSCPSEGALDLALKVGGDVVWLTAPPRAERVSSEDDEWYEGFEPCEAVVVRGYLGKYDVIYTEF